MKKPALCLFAAALLLCIQSAAKGVDPIPDAPRPQRLVNDLAGVLPPYFTDSLERALVAFDDSTSNQIAVVTVRDLYGMDPAQFALQLGNKWGVGSSRDNGIVVLLKPRGEDGYVDVSIQVGHALEGAIPDVYASRIIRNIMGPYLRKDDYMPALSLCCDELQKLASGEISQPRDRSGEDDISPVVALIIVLTIIAIVILLSRHSGSGRGGGGRRGIGPIIFFGGPGGGFGGGSRGGGFGGFGGGSFGGGGASGRF